MASTTLPPRSGRRPLPVVTSSEFPHAAKMSTPSFPRGPTRGTSTFGTTTPRFAAPYEQFAKSAVGRRETKGTEPRAATPPHLIRAVSAPPRTMTAVYSPKPVSVASPIRTNVAGLGDSSIVMTAATEADSVSSPASLSRLLMHSPAGTSLMSVSSTRVGGVSAPYLIAETPSKASSVASSPLMSSAGGKSRSSVATQIVFSPLSGTPPLTPHSRAKKMQQQLQQEESERKERLALALQSSNGVVVEEGDMVPLDTPTASGRRQQQASLSSSSPKTPTRSRPVSAVRDESPQARAPATPVGAAALGSSTVFADPTESARAARRGSTASMASVGSAASLSSSASATGARRAAGVPRCAAPPAPGPAGIVLMPSVRSPLYDAERARHALSPRRAPPQPIITDLADGCWGSTAVTKHRDEVSPAYRRLYASPVRSAPVSSAQSPKWSPRDSPRGGTHTSTSFYHSPVGNRSASGRSVVVYSSTASPGRQRVAMGRQGSVSPMKASHAPFESWEERPMNRPDMPRSYNSVHAYVEVMPEAPPKDVPLVRPLSPLRMPSPPLLQPPPVPTAMTMRSHQPPVPPGPPSLDDLTKFTTTTTSQPLGFGSSVQRPLLGPTPAMQSGPVHYYVEIMPSEASNTSPSRASRKHLRLEDFAGVHEYLGFLRTSAREVLAPTPLPQSGPVHAYMPSDPIVEELTRPAPVVMAAAK